MGQNIKGETMYPKNYCCTPKVMASPRGHDKKCTGPKIKYKRGV